MDGYRFRFSPSLCELPRTSRSTHPARWIWTNGQVIRRGDHSQAQFALYTAPMDEVPTNRRLSSLNSLEDNPLIESAIYFLASTADAEGGHARFMRQIQILK